MSAGRKLRAESLRVTSVTAAMGFIRLGKTITVVGKNGTVVVYRGDGKLWQCKFIGTGDPAIYPSPTVKGVHGWLKEQWPKLGEISR